MIYTPKLGSAFQNLILELFCSLTNIFAKNLLLDTSAIGSNKHCIKYYLILEVF